MTFHKGEKVILTKGTYQGTCGIFLAYKDDKNWADIEETDGAVRSHPLDWLAHLDPKLDKIQIDDSINTVDEIMKV